MSSSDDTGARLLRLAAQRYGKDETSLQLDQDFFEVLGIDSLQALDLLTELEDRFGVEIPDYELQDVRTFSGLVSVIERRL